MMAVAPTAQVAAVLAKQDKVMPVAVMVWHQVFRARQRTMQAAVVAGADQDLNPADLAAAVQVQSTAAQDR